MVSGQWLVAGGCRGTGNLPAARARRLRARGGFTLIELLVVILIILLVSAVALPVVLPALSHRQVSEAARICRRRWPGARFGAAQRHTERHSPVARPGISAGLSGQRPDRPDPAAGRQPDHPHRGGPRVFGGDAVRWPPVSRIR